MKLGSTTVTINRGSKMVLETGDEMTACAITVLEANVLGVDHPIVIGPGAVFKDNIIWTELPEPIVVERGRRRSKPAILIGNSVLARDHR